MDGGKRIQISRALADHLYKDSRGETEKKSLEKKNELFAFSQ